MIFFLGGGGGGGGGGGVSLFGFSHARTYILLLKVSTFPHKVLKRTTNNATFNLASLIYCDKLSWRLLVKLS